MHPDDHARQLDRLGEITGGGTFEQIRQHTTTLTLFGVDVLCPYLEWLIRIKRALAARRP